MKKIYPAFLVAFFLITGFRATAQLTPYYSFSKLTSSYNAITGGTVFGTNFSDDEIYIDATNPQGSFGSATGVGLPIGFNFKFNDIVYDVIGISNNGWITLGQSAFGSSAVNSDLGGQSTFNSPMAFLNSSAPLALQAKISAFATDLQQQSGADLRMETIGVSPNQTMVVQFSGFREDFNSGESIDFQIRLMETSNIVEIMYGNITINGSSDICQVGLRGSASGADFNLLDIHSPNTWSTPATGATVFADADYINMQPALGQTYRWTPPPVCSGFPAIHGVVASSTLICPGLGFSQLGLASSYTNSGISYAWQTSTISPTGPFTPISGFSTSGMVTPTTNVVSWYRPVITCANAGSSTLSAIQVNIAGTTTSTTPYYESFEGPNSTSNFLPNCSWLRTDTTHCKTSTLSNSSNRTPRSGNGFAFFDISNGNGGNNPLEYYSNGIQLNAGVTYSASVWFITSGFSNFNTVKLMYGPNQSSQGLITLASVGFPQNNNYTSLSNTFVVASSGIYYLSVQSNAGNFGNFLAFDDLSVIAPCTLVQNPMNFNLNAAGAICYGDSTVLSASGADNFDWSSGQNTYTIAVSPGITTTYSVVGTNTLSGCTTTLSAQIVVNPTPLISIISFDNELCAGQSLNMVATGGNQYNWSTGSNSALVSVSPGVTTTYSVTGVNGYGCQATATQVIIVNPLPVISVTGNTTVCAGESLNLKGNGAISYEWMSANLYIQSTSISPVIQASAVYTVMGTDAHGCSGTTIISVTAEKCTGLTSLSGVNSNVRIFPNPGTGEFTLELNNGLSKTIEVTDLTGRIILQSKSNNDLVNFNISALANGVYYVKVTSDNSTETLKVVKH